MSELFGGEQELAEFSAVHSVALARMNLRASHVLCRVRADSAIDVRDPVQAAHRRLSTGGRGHSVFLSALSNSEES